MVFTGFRAVPQGSDQNGGAIADQGNGKVGRDQALRRYR